MIHTFILLCGYLYTYIQAVNTYGYSGKSGIGNFSVTQLHSRGASFEWGFNISAELSGFEIVVRPIKKTHYHHHKLTANVADSTDTVDGYNKRKKVYKIKDLDPGTEYELFIYALGKDEVLGASERIVFRTLSGSGDKESRFRADPLECFIVVSILIAWGVAFGVFVHKWGTIRIIQPGDYRPLVDPKNLENIKIVKKPTDSVIYRNYSQKYTTTMQAREKKIERMNTMPNIKVAQEEMIAMDRISPGSPKTARFRDTFLQSEGSPKASSSLSSWMKSSSPSFGTFQMSLTKNKETVGSTSTPSYVDQLRSTALFMMDLDKRSNSSHKPQANAQDLTATESESMQMVPLMRVVEEDEESSRPNLIKEHPSKVKTKKK